MENSFSRNIGSNRIEQFNLMRPRIVKNEHIKNPEELGHT